MASRPRKNSARLRHTLSGVYASATFCGSRPFQASSARRTLRTAASRSKGGSGGRGFSGAMIELLLHHIETSAYARMLRQAVAQLDPGQLASREHVILRRHFSRGVKAASRDVDFAVDIGARKRQRGSAVTTKRAGDPRARLKSGRLSAQPVEVSLRHGKPRHERRAAGAPANRAMAVRAVEEFALHLVPHPPAKTATLQHHDRSLAAKTAHMAHSTIELAAYTVKRCSTWL